MWVSIHHTGWGTGADWDKTVAYFDRAWGFILGNLKSRFETGPYDWTAWMAALRKSHAAVAASDPMPK